MGTIRLSRDQKRARTRELLLDAAGTVFARQGFHGASLDEIAEAAGFSKGAIYSNFDSKEDLFLRVLEQHDRQQRATLAEVLSHGTTLEDRLRSLGEWLDVVVEEERDWSLLTLEFSMYAARNPELQSALAALHQEGRDAVADLIRAQSMELGFPLTDDPHRLAGMIQALSTGISVHRLVEREPLSGNLWLAAVARILDLDLPD